MKNLTTTMKKIIVSPIEHYKYQQTNNFRFNVLNIVTAIDSHIFTVVGTFKWLEVRSTTWHNSNALVSVIHNNGITL